MQSISPVYNHPKGIDTLCRFVLLGFAPSLIALLLLSGSPTPQISYAEKYINASTSNFQTYDNPAFGLKMQYPSDWNIDFSKNSSSSFPLIVVFRSPSPSPSGSPTPTLTVLAKNIGSTNLTLSSLVNTSINSLNSTRNVKFISAKPASLAGSPAEEVVFTNISPQGTDFKVMQLFSLIGNKAYFVTYAAPPADYASNLLTVGTMVKSFEVTK